MTTKLLQGADALAEAALAAGCEFFAGYPMLPFTDLLERMAARLPEVGGVCMNAILLQDSARFGCRMLWRASIRMRQANGHGSMSLRPEGVVSIRVRGRHIGIIWMRRCCSVP